MSFADISTQKRKRGAISLRRKQWEVAQGGNVSMLIFLGKQYLGQSDKQQVITAEVDEADLLDWQNKVDEYREKYNSR